MAPSLNVSSSSHLTLLAPCPVSILISRPCSQTRYYVDTNTGLPLPGFDVITMAPPNMDNPHPVKRPRVGERTLLACVGCKQKKLKARSSTLMCSVSSDFR
jgi:hypothetical protein